MKNYVVFNISKSKFLKFIDIDFFICEYTNNFDDVMLFSSQYSAEKFASYVEEKVAVFEICSIF